MKYHIPDIAELVSEEDWRTLASILGTVREPDEVLAPGGEPYIYRWHLIPRRKVGGNVYLHLQVQDDPDRPLHDHPWKNQSVILSGGYHEVYQEYPPHGEIKQRVVLKGDTVHRTEEEAHRLHLLPEQPYSISLFSTGPVLREWGFWTGDSTWVPYTAIREAGPDGYDQLKKGAFQ
jgi:hypothetical protein